MIAQRSGQLALLGALAAVIWATPVHADPAPPPPAPGQVLPAAPPVAQDPENAFLQSPEAPETTDGDVDNSLIHIDPTIVL